MNIGVEGYFKRYGYKYGILRALFTKFPFHYVGDYENKKILYYKSVKKKINKLYKKYHNEDPADIEFGKAEVKDPVWVYWKQGEANMPDIVKMCIKSIRQYSGGNVILLTDENIEDYIIFPEYIQNRLNSGTMCVAAFSDLLRFSLLEHFGGTWIDATVFLTDTLPDYMKKSELFAFRDSFGLIDNPALMSVWFLHCRKGNVVMKETRNVAFGYWKNNKHVIEYLIPYIILTTVLKYHPNIFKEIPYAVSEYCRLMFSNLGEKYDEKKYYHIKSLTPVHKLSYKFKKEVLSDADNYYNKIICYCLISSKQ